MTDDKSITLSIVDLLTIDDEPIELEEMMWNEASDCRGSRSKSGYCPNVNQCLYQVIDDKSYRCAFDYEHFCNGGQYL